MIALAPKYIQRVKPRDFDFSRAQGLKNSSTRVFMVGGGQDKRFYTGQIELVTLLESARFEKLSSQSTIINLQFQYGKFQPQMILNFLLVLTTIGGVLMLFNLVLGAFFIALAIFPFSILLGKKMIVKLFLKKISEALNIDQKWNQEAIDSM